MLRFDHFLAVAGVDPFTMTADDAQLPEDVLEHFFRWLNDAGYSHATILTYLGGVKSLWRFATAKRYVSPRFSYDAMRAGLAMIIGKPGGPKRDGLEEVRAGWEPVQGQPTGRCGATTPSAPRVRPRP
jgi:hypothetical protein